jgi:hypothetical protein
MLPQGFNANLNLRYFNFLSWWIFSNSGLGRLTPQKNKVYISERLGLVQQESLWKFGRSTSPLCLLGIEARISNFNSISDSNNYCNKFEISYVIIIIIIVTKYLCFLKLYRQPDDVITINRNMLLISWFLSLMLCINHKTWVFFKRKPAPR